MAFLPVVAAVVGAAGAVTSAIAAQQSAKAQQVAANYNATVAANSAAATRQQTDANEEQLRRQQAYQLGRERAGIVDSGQGTGGTAGDIYGQSTGNAELDALNTRYNGYLKAQGLDTQSTLERSYASQYGKNAGLALVGGALNSGTAALSGYDLGTKMQQFLPLGGS